MFFKDIHMKIRLFFVLVVILFLTIIGKVIYIQVFEYEKLSELSSDLWSRNLPVEANRGIIYDRNGEVLADNVTTTSLVLIPNQIKEKERAVTELSKILKISIKIKTHDINYNSLLSQV